MYIWIVTLYATTDNGDIERFIVDRVFASETDARACAEDMKKKYPAFHVRLYQRLVNTDY